MNKREKYFCNLISVYAKDSPGIRNYRIAAFLVYKNQIISWGFNQHKTHPFQAKFATDEHKIFLHAENDAINNALRRGYREELKKATLYIARVKADGSQGNASPCMGCRKTINTFNIKKVIYSTDNGSFQCF